MGMLCAALLSFIGASQSRRGRFMLDNGLERDLAHLAIEAAHLATSAARYCCDAHDNHRLNGSAVVFVSNVMVAYLPMIFPLVSLPPPPNIPIFYLAPQPCSASSATVRGR